MANLSVAIPIGPTNHWAGGFQYIHNMLAALNEDHPQRPERLIVVSDNEERLTGAQQISHSQIRRREWPWRLIQSIEKIDVILPGPLARAEHRSVAWIPDFQEEKFPQYFSVGEVAARRKRNRRWLRKHRHVMVSSNDSRQDLERYYGPLNNRVHVLNFASFVDREPFSEDLTSVSESLGLAEKYFVCSNQLWQHKNHTLIIDAIAQLGSKAPQILFTGKMEDYRNAGHVPTLLRRIASLPSGKILFLGLLPRKEHIAILRGSVAVIQPSLCEGWSTAIEDAKALGKPVLASDIPVHREQIQENAHFFDPFSSGQLADLLEHYARHEVSSTQICYAGTQRRYTDTLVNLINTVADDFDRRGIKPIHFIA